MKKSAWVILYVLLVSFMVACGSNVDSEKKEEPKQQIQVDDDNQVQNEETTPVDEVEEIIEKKSSDEEFIENIKKGLQDRWDLIDDSDENMSPEEDVDNYINGYIAAERNSLGVMDDYDFKDDNLKSLADRYFKALDITEANYSNVFIDEDEEAEVAFFEGQDERKAVVRQLVDEYGLEFDAKYELDVEEFLEIITEVESTFESGYDLEKKLKDYDVTIIGVGFGRIDDDEAYLTAKVLNNTDKKLKNFQIAYIAWNKDGRPIKVDSDDFYVVLDYDEVDIPAGGISEYDGGVITTADPEEIYRIGAIVLSGEYDDGTTFENPYIDEWEEIYLGEEYEEFSGETETNGGDENEGIESFQKKSFSLADFYGSITVDDFHVEQFELKKRADDYGMKYFADIREGNYHIDFVSDRSPYKSDGLGSEQYEFDCPHIKLVYERDFDDRKYYLSKVSFRKKTGSVLEITGTYWADSLRYKVKDEYFDTAQEAVDYLRGL